MSTGQQEAPPRISVVIPVRNEERCLRETLEAEFDVSYEPYLSLLGELRPIVRERIASPAQRKALWAALLDSDILALFRSDAHQAARQRAMAIVDAFS